MTSDQIPSRCPEATSCDWLKRTLALFCR
jgi:hypothetical protein